MSLSVEVVKVMIRNSYLAHFDRNSDYIWRFIVEDFGDTIAGRKLQSYEG